MPLADGRPEQARQEGLLQLMATSPRLQRQCACGAPSAGGGSCSACEATTAATFRSLQRKPMEIGTADDPLERQADAVAEQVMRMEAPPETPLPVALSNRPMVAPSGMRTAAGGEAPPSVHAALASPGQPLAPSERAFFEPRFGVDLSGVRVHADALAEQSAVDVNALAYTVGSHVFFGPGRFAPASTDDRRLLAHELAHVVQQKGVPHTIQRTVGTDPCSYRGDAVKQREVHLNLGMNAVRVFTRGGSPVTFTNLITGAATFQLARQNGWCHMYSVKGHQSQSSHGLINFVNYCGNFGFHSNFWRQNGRTSRIPGEQSAGCARLHDADDRSTDSGDSRRFFDLVEDDDCVRIYERASFREPTFKRCPSGDEDCTLSS